MENYLKAHGIGLHLGTAAAAFSRRKDGQIRVELNNNTNLDTDLVLLSAGVRPAVELAVAAGLELGERGGIKVDHRMRTSDPSIWAAGDAVETEHTVLPGSWLMPLAGPANRQGRVVAENMCGRDTTYTTTQGTSIVKVFDMVAGGTGASEKQLVAAGLPYEMVNLHPSGHAGYYPGTAKMHMKVLFDPRVRQAPRRSGGRLRRRRQAPGRAGHGRPPGSDGLRPRAAGAGLRPAVRLGQGPGEHGRFRRLQRRAGRPRAVARARLARQCGGLPARRRPQSCRVRHLAPARCRAGAAEDAARGVRRTGTASQPLRVYCATGFRSYLAHRSLVQRGFTDVRMLSGGRLDVPRLPRRGARRVRYLRPAVSYAEDRSTPAFGGSEVRRQRRARGDRRHRAGLPGPDHGSWPRPWPPSPSATRCSSTSPTRASRPTRRRGPTRTGTRLVEITPEGPGYAAVVPQGRRGPRRRPGRAAVREAVDGRLLRRLRQGPRRVHHRQRRRGPWETTCRCSSPSGG